jgi:uncharacterized alkaline shock family protein YloU
MTVANRQRSKSAGTASRAAAGEGDVRIPASEAGAVRGGVSIAESVVEMIAATAASEVPGIYPGNGPGGITSELSRAFGARQDGIRARIKHDKEVSLEMRMAVDYGEHIPTRGEEVRVVVARAIRKLTDLETREIKVKVTEVLVPKTDQAEGALPEQAESQPVASDDAAGRV